jgi:hypothetical protein
VVGKNGAEKLEIGISDPIPAHTLWRKAFAVLCHIGQTYTFGNGEERFPAFKDI